MAIYIGLVLLASSCLARSSSGCAATLSDLLALCHSGQYLDTRTCTCRNCTYVCPANQIVRRLCSPVSDSVCGPFFEFRQRKKTEKRKWEATTESAGAGLAIGEHQGQQLYSSANGIRNDDADDGMKVHSRWFLGLLISAAAAALFMLIAAVSTIVIVASRKKKLRNIVASRTDYRRMMVSPDEGTSSANRPDNRSVVHIESQLIWNSQRRGGGGGVALLLGRGYNGGNDYVRESDQKAALSTSDAVDYYN